MTALKPHALKRAAVVVSAVALAAGFCLLWLFFPVYGAWAVLVALGRLPGDSRPFMLSLGMFFSAVGLWTAPMGLRALISPLPFVGGERTDALLAPFEKAWPAAGPVLLLAAARAAWLLRGDFARSGADDAFFAAFSALGLTLSSGALIYFAAWAPRSEREHFGAISFAVDTPACAPGEEIRAHLKVEKRPASVSAVLELYLEGGDRPAKTAPASVAGPDALPDGCLYRVTAVMPAEPRPKPEEGGWVLGVKAKGARGGTFEDGGPVELRGNGAAGR